MSRRNQPGHGDNGRNLIRRGMFRGLNPVVTTAASALVGAWLLMGAVWTDTTNRVLSVARDLVGPVLEWYYVLVVVFLLGFVLWLGLGRYRDIRLGGDDERPEFSLPSWIAMLFAAGTGVGLIFWSIAEPVLHFQGNPFTSQAETPESAAAGMRLTLFHWGLNGWAIFASVALALAYFGYRKGLPLTIRSTLYPFIGTRIYGWPGHLVDTIAVFGTVFGIATTLGLGAAQMNTGINELTGVGVSLTRQLVLIAIVTGLATISVVSGVRRGVRWLSIGNLWLSLILLLFFLIAGPTNYLLRHVVQGAGAYLQNLVEMSFWTNVTGSSEWQQDWTVFYWGWWFAWSPFVGMFIARISKGRTLREFVFGVLLFPTVFSLLWIGLLGGSALHNELYGPGGITAAVSSDVTVALYRTIELVGYPGSVTIAMSIATVLIATYFITSADSGTLVINTILSNGNPDPPLLPRVFWGVAVGALTGTLLAAGGIPTLQAAVVMAGLPFSFVALIMVSGMISALREEVYGPRAPETRGLPKEPWTGRDN